MILYIYISKIENVKIPQPLYFLLFNITQLVRRFQTTKKELKIWVFGQIAKEMSSLHI